MKVLHFTAALAEPAALAAELPESAALSGLLPEEKVMRNAPGGYYLPKIEAVGEDSLRISYTPSKLDMPAVESRTFSLPAGRDGTSPTVQLGSAIGSDGRPVYSVYVHNGDGHSSGISWRDGDTPYIGDNGNWYLGRSDTGMPSRGEDGPGLALPAYWQTHVDARAEQIRQAMGSAGRNRAAFLFYTDAHWDNSIDVGNSRNAPVILKYLCRYTPIRKTFFGGDIVRDGTDPAYLWQWRAAVSDLPHHHSVPGEKDGTAGDAPFLYTFLQAAEEHEDLVRDEAGLWYYLDCPWERTRYLCMDTAFQGDSDDQAAFVIQALTTAPDGWHIGVIAHKWLRKQEEGGGMDPDGAKWLGLFDAYNARSAGTFTIRSAGKSYHFGTAGAAVEFCIGGHIHADSANTRSAGGIPVITVDSDGHDTDSGLDSEVGTISAQSVSGVIADYGARKLHIIRIGRGASFDVDLKQ